MEGRGERRLMMRMMLARRVSSLGSNFEWLSSWVCFTSERWVS